MLNLSCSKLGQIRIEDNVLVFWLPRKLTKMKKLILKMSCFCYGPHIKVARICNRTQVTNHTHYKEKKSRDFSSTVILTLFLMKFQVLRPAALFKSNCSTLFKSCFPVNFATILRTSTL